MFVKNFVFYAIFKISNPFYAKNLGSKSIPQKLVPNTESALNKLVASQRGLLGTNNHIFFSEIPRVAKDQHLFKYFALHLFLTLNVS